MTSFKQELARRIRHHLIRAIALAAFVVIVFVLKLRGHGSIEAMDFLDTCFLFGLFFGGTAASLRAILAYRRALATPEALEALHIEETDERNRAIILKTCRSTLSLTCQLLGFAGIIASFYSLTVLWTIALTLVAIVALYAVLSLYYARNT